jgi:hypothetical protein
VYLTYDRRSSTAPHSRIPRSTLSRCRRCLLEMRMPPWWTAADESSLVVSNDLVTPSSAASFTCTFSNTSRPVSRREGDSSKRTHPCQGRESTIECASLPIDQISHATGTPYKEGRSRTQRIVSTWYRPDRRLRSPLPQFHDGQIARQRSLANDQKAAMLNSAPSIFTWAGAGDTLRIRVLGLAVADPAHLYL